MAVSVASDLTALQLVKEYWNTNSHHFPYWEATLLLWVLVLGLNVVHVRLYGEEEYCLVMLKMMQ